MRKYSFVFVFFFTLFLTVNVGFAEDKEYIIGKGDSLSIRVWGEPELSVETVVRPDGKISIPNVGEMRVIGITPRLLRRQIANALTEYLYNPVVSVSVHSFPANSVVVYGPGVTSNVIPLNGKTTILQLLSTIKPDYNADLTNAYIEREGEIVARNFQALFKDGIGEGADFEVLASDRLFIPKKLNRLVFIEGAVNNPTSVPYSENMTILEAIHIAGGLSKFADPNDTIVTRQGAGEAERIKVRLSDLINKGDMSQNIRLQSGDLIVVDTSWF